MSANKKQVMLVPTHGKALVDTQLLPNCPLLFVLVHANVVESNSAVVTNFPQNMN